MVELVCPSSAATLGVVDSNSISGVDDGTNVGMVIDDVAGADIACGMIFVCLYVASAGFPRVIPDENSCG